MKGGRRPKMKKSSVSGLAALLVFAVFAVCLAGVLLTGAKSYSSLTDRGGESYEKSTALQFFAAKIRQSPSGSAVSISDFGGTDALLIRENIDGQAYSTLIYCHDGWLMELFTAEGGDFAPEDGEKILPAESLSLSLEDDLLRIELPEGGISLALRGGEGAQ